MAGPRVSCRTWPFFDLTVEQGPLSFTASFPPSGEGLLIWRVTGWKIPGIGSVSVRSPPEWGGFSLEPCSLCPGAGYTAPCVFLMGHLIRRGLSCLPRVPAKYLAPICDSSREGAAISAVCSFRPQDIQAVLNGPFRELKHDCNRGLPVMDNDVPQPRPGEVRGLKN